MGMRKTFVNLAMEVKKKKDFCRLKTQKREKVRNFPYKKIFLAFLIVISFGLGTWTVKTGASIVAEGGASARTPGLSSLDAGSPEFDAVSAFVRESAMKLSENSDAAWKSGTEKESISHARELFSKNKSSSYIIDEIYKIRRGEETFLYQARCHPVDFPERKLFLNAVPIKDKTDAFELETVEEE